MYAECLDRLPEYSRLRASGPLALPRKCLVDMPGACRQCEFRVPIHQSCQQCHQHLPRSTGRKSKRSLTCHVTITPSMGLRTSGLFFCARTTFVVVQGFRFHASCAHFSSHAIFSSLEPLSSSNDRRIATSCSSWKLSCPAHPS